MMAVIHILINRIHYIIDSIFFHITRLIVMLLINIIKLKIHYKKQMCIRKETTMVLLPEIYRTNNCEKIDKFITEIFFLFVIPENDICVEYLWKKGKPLNILEYNQLLTYVECILKENEYKEHLKKEVENYIENVSENEFILNPFFKKIDEKMAIWDNVTEKEILKDFFSYTVMLYTPPLYSLLLIFKKYNISPKDFENLLNHFWKFYFS